jgi:hypothetical protein
LKFVAQVIDAIGKSQQVAVIAQALGNVSKRSPTTAIARLEVLFVVGVRCCSQIGSRLVDDVNDKS